MHIGKPVAQYESVTGTVHAKGVLRHGSEDQVPADGRIQTSVVIPLSEDTGIALSDLAGRIRAPLKSVLLTAHLRALGALTGSRDLITALITNGRPEVLDGDKAVGLFLNSVPFRIQLAAETWRELIGRVMYAEQDHAPAPPLSICTNNQRQS